jgi:sporadic carbohydrate cluster protein (TIGR04323 family)
MSAARTGYRGYISSRPIGGDRVPQSVQNLMVRDYARRNGLDFLLSATEYAMPGCFMMLEQVIDEMDMIGGAILYSLVQLPEDETLRQSVMSRALASGGALHAALEGLVLAGDDDLQRWNDIIRVRQTLPFCPKDLS